MTEPLGTVMTLLGLCSITATVGVLIKYRCTMFMIQVSLAVNGKLFDLWGPLLYFGIGPVRGAVCQAPSLSAILMRPASESACIFCITWPRCSFTVASLMPNSPAICLLRRPRTTSAITSCSRELSDS